MRAVFPAVGYFEAMSEDRANRTTSVRDWIKENALVTCGVIGSALTVFQGLEPFLKLSRLALWVVEHWRDIVVLPWTWLGSLIAVPVSSDVASIISFYVFVFVFTWRSRSTRAHTSIPATRTPLYGLVVAAFMAAVVNLFLSPIGIDDLWSTFLISLVLLVSLIYSLGNLTKYHVLSNVGFFIVLSITSLFIDIPTIYFADVLLIVYVVTYWIFVMTKSGTEYQERAFLICKVGARNAIRVTMIIIVLVCMNWIGVYAPAIWAWIDKRATLL